MCFFFFVVFFQAEDGIRDLVRSRGLGDVYKRQDQTAARVLPVGYASELNGVSREFRASSGSLVLVFLLALLFIYLCLLYTSDAADERSSGDLGGRRLIKKKNSVSTANTSLAITSG